MVQVLCPTSATAMEGDWASQQAKHVHVVMVSYERISFCWLEHSQNYPKIVQFNECTYSTVFKMFLVFEKG